VLQAQLRSWGTSTAHAVDSRGALEHLSRVRQGGEGYDAVLLDWQVPDADRLVSHLRGSSPAERRAAPALLIMATAGSRDLLTQTFKGAWPDTLLTKPVLASPLLDALLQIRHQRRTGAAAFVRSGESARVAGALAEALHERAAPLRGASVLLVEDNPLNQTVARQFLERMGIEVLVADDGASALAAIANARGGRFDAVLMDLHMPVMDGLEATRRIRARPDCALLPVIGMTAAALPEDRASCLAVGMVDHLAKPITPERLLAMLLKWIARGGGSAEMSPTSAVDGPLQAASSPPPSGEGAAIDVDFASLRHQLQGDEASMRRVLGRFVELESEAAQVLARRLADEDMKGAQNKAHDLKGVAATVGLLGLSRASAQLEDVLRSGQPPQEALERVQRALELGLRAVRSELAAAGNPPSAKPDGAER